MKILVALVPQPVYNAVVEPRLPEIRMDETIARAGWTNIVLDDCLLIPWVGEGGSLTHAFLWDRKDMKGLRTKLDELHRLDNPGFYADQEKFDAIFGSRG